MMKRLVLPGLLLVLIPLPLPAANKIKSKPWTDYPLIQRVAPFSRGEARLRALNIHSDRFQIYASIKKGQTAPQWVVKLEQGQGRFRPAGGKQGAYHLVVAQQDTGNELRIASAVVAFPNPAPPPRQMLSNPKAPLEVTPIKLPREHAHYRAGEQWDFLVRYRGKPLPQANVYFATANGTTQTLHADERGVVSVVFPDDFKKQGTDARQHAQHRRDRGAAFVLATQLKTTTRNITSAFNYRYLHSDWQNKNLWLGSGFALFGMLVASPLLLRRSKAGAKA